MIGISTKIHDSYSIEFKLGFKPHSGPGRQDFSVGMWIFVPASLDINSATYTKTDFYRDVKSNIRLVTPVYALDSIAGGTAEPVHSVLEAAPEEYEYQLKRFAAIVKSSLRDCRGYDDAKYAACVEQIFDAYWKFPACEAHSLCGEFLCNICSQFLFKRMEDGGDKALFTALILRIDGFRHERGYITVKPGADAENCNYVYRQGVLKKYVERPFYLRAPKKKDGVVAEQAWYSVAAGMAMLFATVVGWAFQRHFGNLTWPLFIALIISYMMKDRIKELMRYYFSHKVGARYFDNKAKIIFKDKVIGSLKEGMDFVPMSKIPADVLEIRNRHRMFEGGTRVPDEKVILYRKTLSVDRDVNDIVRLNLSNFLHMADNPLKPVKALDSAGNVCEVMCAKDYHINIVVEYRQGEQQSFRHLRIHFTRDGIQSIEEI